MKLDSSDFKIPNPGSCLQIMGCVGSSKAVVLAHLLKMRKSPAAFVTSGLKEAIALKEDLAFFLPPKIPVLLFPPLDVLPYHQLSPNPDVIMDRLGQLQKISGEKGPFVIILPVAAAFRRLIPRKIFEEKTIRLTMGDRLDREELMTALNHLGYMRTPLVEDRGTFAVRGGILDIFPPQLETPCRLELFGDTLETLRLFDPATQKSVRTLGAVDLIPAREILFNSLPEGWKGNLKKRGDEVEIPKTERDRIADFFSNGIYFAGSETFLPFIYRHPASFFDYLPGETLLCMDDARELIQVAGMMSNNFEQHHAASHSGEKMIKPHEAFLDPKEWEELAGFFPQIDFTPFETSASPSSFPLPRGERVGERVTTRLIMEGNEFLKSTISVGKNREKALEPVASLLNERRKKGDQIFLVASSPSQKERLADLLSRYNLPLFQPENKEQMEEISSHIQVVLGPLSSGFYWPDAKQWWLTDEEIFGQKTRRGRPAPTKGEAFSSFAELHPGDFVVHEDHGVAIYRGLKSLEIGRAKNDFLILEYLGGDKLYLPAHQIGRLYRYQAKEGAHPLLDKMGGSSWKKVREKIRVATRKLARELLEIQALREGAKGYAFSPQNILFEEFEATFPFEETNDQQMAINDVIKDMETGKPMDRLVCGDVGYGKTEVAIRAAYKAVLDSKQAALLVPTTVLAFQHYENFRKRFADFPVKVALLSRFQSRGEQKKIVEQLATGELDIVVATHRLLSADVAFRDLGLLVIDEEQHFGVGQKEKIKKLRSLVDVLTLSATPIPRTLNFALVGIRDLSVINTPPADRLAIRTYVTHFDPTTLGEAITREVKRGGQIYFVHNRIQTIRSIADKLAKIVPEVRCKIAHGQMPEDELENIMIDFMEKKFDLLLCTTIIEAGLDIPNVNTIVINHAEHFGLSQLYQLRGRVGRSFHRAYCYLLIPHDSILPDVAKRRLSVIQRFTDLGSGFKIATHDLEIRGAGDILGGEQSGHITAIGYDLYVKLLEEAVLKLKGEGLEEEIETELKLPLKAYIPEEMVPDTSLRLVLYKRISSVKKSDEGIFLREEWIDRFGKLPPEVENLFTLMTLKIRARKLGISQVIFQKDEFVYQIAPSSPLPTDYFLNKFNREPKKYKILPDGKFLVRKAAASEKEIFAAVLSHLAEMEKAL